jgi:hypothetical protein
LAAIESIAVIFLDFGRPMLQPRRNRALQLVEIAFNSDLIDLAKV